MKIAKVLFDYLLALAIMPFLLPVIILLTIVSTIDTGEFGLFSQIRIGKNGQPFFIYKIRTMKGKYESPVTTSNTHHITAVGEFIRKTKLDEIPQLFNILLGEMSFVGPRPDVPGYADLLTGEDRIVLTVKPGITGPVQLEFRNEEEELAKQKNPVRYNDEILWPQKVKINREYVENWSFAKDLKYMVRTVF